MNRIPHALGSLCPKGHDHGGGSLRYIINGQPIGSCVDCGRAANNEHRASLRETRAAIAKAQKRTDGKYVGTPCRKGHPHLRYVRDGSCVECDKLRNKRRRESPGGKSYERARKQRENQARATDEFYDEDLRTERVKTFIAESRLRKFRKAIAHGNTYP